VQAALLGWRSPQTTGPSLPEEHLLEANRNLRELLEDTSVPSTVRQALEPEFREIEALAEKLRREEIHVAAFGRVGTGKSSLLNALVGQTVFSTSPLHGETRESRQVSWHAPESGRVELIDTPGIDELDGEERERLARSVARRADILLFVAEGDLTDTEFEALSSLCARRRPVLLVLNKSDRYTAEELQLLLNRLAERCAGILEPDHVIASAADPRPETVIRVAADGTESEGLRNRAPEVMELRSHLWQVLEKEGKSLAALNAALFASELDSRIAERIVEVRREVADKIIRNYCIGKGLAVAANPVPVADLLAAAGIDIAMVSHLGQLYGHSLSRREALKLLLTIAAQLSALLGAYWGVNLVSSALKGISAGMSTVLTGAAQGALAWYATYVIGTAAESYFALGKTWGPDGPRETVRGILDNLDRDSILITAREEILEMLNQPVGGD
jgi:small GTP-binding protein